MQCRRLDIQRTTPPSSRLGGFLISSSRQTYASSHYSEPLTMNTDFCRKCRQFTYVNRNDICSDCLSGIPVRETPKPAASVPIKPPLESPKGKPSRAEPAPVAGRPSPQPERVPIFPKPGTLPDLLLRTLKKQSEPVKVGILKDVAITAGYSFRSVRTTLDVLANRELIYVRKIYKDGHRAYSLYSVKPFPALVDGEPVKAFLEEIRGRWQSVPILASVRGCSRTNIKHLYDKSLKRGYKVNAKIVKNTRFYKWNP